MPTDTPRHPRRQSAKRNALHGVVLATLLSFIHAAGWGLYCSFGPTPRDFGSPAAFGGRVFAFLAVVGAVVALPWGAFCGVLRARHPGLAARVFAVLAASPLALFAGVVSIASRGAEFVAALPAIMLAALGGYLLARWSDASG